MKLPWREVAPPIGRVGPMIFSSLTFNEATWLVTHSYGQVIEVGAAFGFSTVCLAEHATRVLSIDPHMTHASLEECGRNLAVYGLREKVELREATSAAVLPDLPPASCDLMFIDGDHEFAGVMFDAEQALRLVRRGGWMVFHDFGEETCPNVGPAIQSFCARHALAMSALVDTLAAIQHP